MDHLRDRVLRLIYSRLKLTLKPKDIAIGLRGKMVDIYDFPDGRLEVR